MRPPPRKRITTTKQWKTFKSPWWTASPPMAQKWRKKRDETQKDRSKKWTTADLYVIVLIGEQHTNSSKTVFFFNALNALSVVVVVASKHYSLSLSRVVWVVVVLTLWYYYYDDDASSSSLLLLLFSYNRTRCGRGATGSSWLKYSKAKRRSRLTRLNSIIKPGTKMWNR